MKKKFKFGVIGAGFMSTAIIKGIINAGFIDCNDIIVSDMNQEQLDKVANLGVEVTLNNKFLADNSEFVLFAIKPQNLQEVLMGIKDCDCSKFISIMAGIKKDKIKSLLNRVSVARCMPNTPCSIGMGAVGLDLSDYSNESDINFIKNIFSSFAKVVLVSEDKLNAVTGVSGSSPAYFYLFLKGVVDAGIKHGLTEEDSKNLAVNTMVGAGKMVLDNPDKSLDDLINAVCSKGGTTIEAINVYRENNLDIITETAINACIKRAKELENL
ncbi:MAG: pyrroline-5-carboxylate reductase [Clostridia bacterium]|nr:pyrroline-5-carboxylate reductase [Clostridia bacterium]